MAHVLSVCGVILAAGESSRMGQDKALLPWPPTASGNVASETFLSAAIRMFLPYADVVWVVVGKNESALAPIVYANGASLLVNPDPSRGQFSSLRVGLHEILNRGRDSAMVTLVDRPPVRAETMETLLGAFELAPAKNKWAVVPEYRGKHGHPILIGRELLEQFLKAPETSNARGVESEYQGKIEYVSVDDALVSFNIDTPEQYAALASSINPK